MNSTTSQSEFLKKLSTHPIERGGAVALHWQCSEALKLTIEELHYPPAVPLPSENDMAEALRISRPTLRQAMARLASDGVIHTQRGIGAFALGGALVRKVGLNSLYRDLVNEGRAPTTHLVHLGETVADERTAAGLRIAVGTPLQDIERVRLADGVPIVLIRSKLALPETTSTRPRAGRSPWRSAQPMTLSTALCRPTSSATRSGVPSAVKSPAACRPPVRSKAR